MNIIGLDIGTTTISAVVIDAQTGKIRASRTVANGADLTPDVPGGRLQDPDIIIGKLKAVLAELQSAYAPIETIGIDGQMHGMLYVDAQGKAVSPLYTWQDNRGTLPCGEGTYVSEIKRICGVDVSTGFGLTTHYWMTVNNKIPAEAVKLCSIFDYAAMSLTGCKEPLMHSSGAASFGLYDIYGFSWMFDAIRACGMNTDYLPMVTTLCAVVGKTADGIPVSCGIGDNQASFIGSVRDDNSVLVNMGTGGQVSMRGFTDHPIEDLEMRPLVGDSYIIAGSTLCGGRAYAMLENFIRSVAALSGYNGDKLYEAMNEAAARGEADEDPWTIDTRFSGTRRQPTIRGSISGIGIDNFDAEHLVRGVINGIAEEIMDLFEKIPNPDGVKPAHLIGSGNGLRRNAALRKAFEKRFGLDMKIPAHNEEAAYGAALYGYSAGTAVDLAVVQKLIRYEAED